MTKQLPDGTLYNERQVVARMESIGFFRMLARGRERKFHIWGYMTFWTGDNSPAIAAKFDRVAPQDEKGNLVTVGLKAGEIVVMPGFVYKIIPMTGAIMTEHLRVMRTWKPRVKIEYVKDDAPAVDLGTINPMGNA